MESDFSHSIWDIANWERDGIIDIPALQRGLVWAPHQVELLWDSILRGFPIGAFALTPVCGNERQITNGTKPSAKYFLLDGQQRYNAIKSAFMPWADDPNVKSVLWIDFMPPVGTNSTRRFWVKTITRAHPWGFANNDTCSTLGWGAYREALKRFTGSEDTRIQDVKMSQAWPIKARCPVPFSTVLELFEQSMDEQSFCDSVISWCNAHSGIGAPQRDWGLIGKCVKHVHSAFVRMRGYRVVANILQPEMLDERDVVENGNLEDEGTNSLEQLFTRINTLGTPISPYDLGYSAIKAYWGGIKDANDDIAGTIMPAAHLAILSFRLALTLASDKKGFADSPSVQKIRRLKVEDDSESKAVRGFVDELYDNGGIRLRGIIEQVEKALRVYRRENDAPDGLPAVIRTSIILNSPDVYLMLIYMAYKGRLADYGNVVGLATWLHWFALGQQKVIADAVKEVVDGGDKAMLRVALRSCYAEHELLEPVEASDNNFLFPMKFLKDDNTACDWSSYENESWYPLFDRIWSQRELVIFATRKYFNREFRYDPAETKFLTGHNKPWDVDHIVPKSWVSRQGVSMGRWQDVCKAWIWSNGNYAAIPFTMNRSKGARSDWEYYMKRTKELFFKSGVMELQSDTMTADKDMAMRFVQITHERMIAMYEEWRKEVIEFL